MSDVTFNTLHTVWTLANPHSSFENFQICEDRQKTNSYIHQ